MIGFIFIVITALSAMGLIAYSMLLNAHDTRTNHYVSQISEGFVMLEAAHRGFFIQTSSLPLSLEDIRPLIYEPKTGASFTYTIGIDSVTGKNYVCLVGTADTMQVAKAILAAAAEIGPANVATGSWCGQGVPLSSANLLSLSFPLMLNVTKLIEEY